MATHFRTNKNEEVLEKSIKFCDELEKIVHKESSQNFLFYYYRLKSIHHINLHEFITSIELTLKLQDLVENSPSLNINSSKSGLQMELAKLFIQTGQYTRAQEVAKNAVENFKDGMINQLRAAEILFFSYLRDNKLSKAKEIIEYAMSHKQYKDKRGNKTYTARWEFYKANILYLLGEKTLASNLLSQNTVLAKDRSGWELGLRILEIMMRIDENAWDIVGYNQTNFYKLLNNIKKKESNIFRAEKILHIIRILSRSGGDFTLTKQRVNGSLELLTAGKGKYYWDPTGFEVIRFDQWFLEKAK